MEKIKLGDINMKHEEIKNNKKDENEIEKKHSYRLCVVKDNQVLFVNKNGNISFPVISYEQLNYKDITNQYGMESLTPLKSLGTYNLTNQDDIEIFSVVADIKNDKTYKKSCADENMLFIDINLVEDYLSTHITLEEDRVMIDTIITKSLKKFQGVEEAPKELKLIIT